MLWRISQGEVCVLQRLDEQTERLVLADAAAAEGPADVELDSEGDGAAEEEDGDEVARQDLLRRRRIVLGRVDREYGYTPLIWAARNGQTAAVSWLLQASHPNAPP